MDEAVRWRLGYDISLFPVRHFRLVMIPLSIYPANSNIIFEGRTGSP